MEENTIFTSGETTPQETPEVQDTPAARAAAPAADADAGVTDTAEGADETTGDETAGDDELTGDDGDAPLTIPVRYNHKNRVLTVEQAQVLAQKGMKFDELSPVLDKLRFLAAADGVSLAGLADALLERREKQRYQALLDECGGNEALAGRLFEAEQAKAQEQFRAARADEQAAADAADKQADDALVRRLADEFVGLQAQFPALTAFGQLPRPVLDMAVRQDLPLLDAYLRHRHAEARKIAAARAAQERAATASAGSQAAGAGETANPTIDAMLAGVWDRRGG